MSSFLNARIDSLAIGGNGVCRINGKVCFVPFACPGDLLALEITSEKKSYLTARIAAILEPSQSRVIPLCPVFGRCGGCAWQHIDYSCQLEQKYQMFSEALWRGARVDSAVISPVVPAPSPFGYRGRVQLKLYGGGTRLQIGFFRHGSHFVEDTPCGCPVARLPINHAMGQLRDVLARFSGVGQIPQINLEAGDQGLVATVNYIGPDRAQAIDFFTSERQRLSELSGVWLQSGRKSSLMHIWGDKLLFYGMPTGERHQEMSLEFAPGGFSQVNFQQNRIMSGLIRRMVRESKSKRLLDLYCGNGNFSLPLASDVISVTGVESYSGSIISAQANCHRNSVDNAAYLCADSSAAVSELVRNGMRFDTIILDPPRAGAADVIDSLCTVCPSTIIYISCDPSTLARDCGILAGRGFKVTESVPVDMFPQTPHLESVTMLKAV